jgi:hypothetical protein
MTNDELKTAFARHSPLVTGVTAFYLLPSGPCLLVRSSLATRHSSLLLPPFHIQGIDFLENLGAGDQR